MYLLNYASTLEQLRRFCQVCHDALRPGGRFVGVNDNVRNPPVGTVSWRKYGLENSCPPQPESIPTRRASGPDVEGVDADACRLRSFEVHLDLERFLHSRDPVRSRPEDRDP